eukprot:CAMPEP_0172451296 /NCGR_PEP_ID=MMETSP1065-20121228/9391_1 /TAXON_ID=265537 /ORGANISM="Amphiprora paludosa, Strain CCMP125" /LENGTH=524 /DNA_ID=CAMNT_0013203239 /DNA_START=14 /DNA_END=1585 /DNA_ORIENTATION=-
MTPMRLEDHHDDSLMEESNNNYHPASLTTIYRMEHLAIPACYFMVGLVQGLTYPLINVYPLDLGATEAQQTTLSSLKGLPSCFKIFFGVLSDTVPIAGYRRKPYMLLGWTIASVSLLFLILVSDLSFQRVSSNDVSILERGDDDNVATTVVAIPPENAPSMPLLSTTFFIWATGVWWADVMGDSLVAEKAQFETPQDRGNLQIVCYLWRGVGFVGTAALSSWIYNFEQGPLWIVSTAALLPWGMVPILYRFHETCAPTTHSTQEYWQELWGTCCSKAVWQPMGFIYLYVVLFVSNAAWREFLKTVLGFTPNQLNALLILAAVMGFVGLVLYKVVLIRWSWRWIFMIGILVNGVFSALQLLLIQGYTGGMSPFLFALGDDAMTDMIAGTQYIPTVVMLVSLVPEGIEGASYALFTTTWNVGGVLSEAFSTVLLRIWDVSKETLAGGDLSGMTNLTLLTTALQMTPILFVSMIPHRADDLIRMNQNARDGGHERSLAGGITYVTVVSLSVTYAIYISIMNIFDPGW